MSEELKPCPFCQSRAEHYSFCYRKHTVRCRYCLADCGEHDTPERAAFVWNTRPAEQSLKAEVEQLKSVIAEIAATLATGAEISEDDIFTMCKDAVGEKAVLDRYNEKLRERAGDLENDSDR